MRPTNEAPTNPTANARGLEGEGLHLPAEAMPLEPAERMRRLFEARKRWTLEDVAPYLRCVFSVGVFGQGWVTD